VGGGGRGWGWRSRHDPSENRDQESKTRMVFHKGKQSASFGQTIQARGSARVEEDIVPRALAKPQRLQTAGQQLNIPEGRDSHKHEEKSRDIKGGGHERFGLKECLRPLTRRERTKRNQKNH